MKNPQTTIAPTFFMHIISAIGGVINDLRLLFHCNILIPRKCPHKTLFKAQWGRALTNNH